MSSWPGRVPAIRVFLAGAATTAGFLVGALDGEALIAAMQASPHRDIDVEPKRTPMPVRKVSLAGYSAC
jgi:hypothetical protein